MIPKAGKTDYTVPKAYRPISLTPFLFKLLERVNAWDIIETALKTNPLHKDNMHIAWEGAPNRQLVKY